MKNFIVLQKEIESKIIEILGEANPLFGFYEKKANIYDLSIKVRNENEFSDNIFSGPIRNFNKNLINKLFKDPDFVMMSVHIYIDRPDYEYENYVKFIEKIKDFKYINIYSKPNIELSVLINMHKNIEKINEFFEELKIIASELNKLDHIKNIDLKIITKLTFERTNELIENIPNIAYLTLNKKSIKKTLRKYAKNNEEINELYEKVIEDEKYSIINKIKQNMSELFMLEVKIKHYVDLEKVMIF